MFFKDAIVLRLVRHFSLVCYRLLDVVDWLLLLLVFVGFCCCCFFVVVFFFGGGGGVYFSLHNKVIHNTF